MVPKLAPLTSPRGEDSAERLHHRSNLRLSICLMEMDLSRSEVSLPLSLLLFILLLLLMPPTEGAALNVLWWKAAGHSWLTGVRPQRIPLSENAPFHFFSVNSVTVASFLSVNLSTSVLFLVVIHHSWWGPGLSRLGRADRLIWWTRSATGSYLNPGPQTHLRIRSWGHQRHDPEVGQWRVSVETGPLCSILWKQLRWLS